VPVVKGMTILNTENLASQLKRLRLDAGLTQAQLAEHVGLSYTAISKIETGARVTTTPVLFKWLDACGVALTISSTSGTGQTRLDQDESDSDIVRLLATALPHLGDSQKEMLRVQMASLMSLW